MLREGAMSQLFYLSSEQLERIKPFFPLSHGVSRVDDLRVLSGIIYVIKHGLQWKDAPREYGLIKLCTTALYAGVAWAYSTTSLQSLQKQQAMIAD